MKLVREKEKVKGDGCFVWESTSKGNLHLNMNKCYSKHLKN